MTWCSEIQISLSICSISYLLSEKLAYISRERTSCLVTSMKETTQNEHQFHFVLVCLTKLPQMGAIALGCFSTEDWCCFTLSSPLRCYMTNSIWGKGFLAILMAGIGTSLFLQREVEVAELEQRTVGRFPTFQACSWWDGWGQAVAVVSGSSYLALPTTLPSRSGNLELQSSGIGKATLLSSWHDYYPLLLNTADCSRLFLNSKVLFYSHPFLSPSPQRTLLPNNLLFQLLYKTWPQPVWEDMEQQLCIHLAENNEDL